jgi:hypothetical protein
MTPTMAVAITMTMMIVIAISPLSLPDLGLLTKITDLYIPLLLSAKLKEGILTEISHTMEACSQMRNRMILTEYVTIMML